MTDCHHVEPHLVPPSLGMHVPARGNANPSTADLDLAEPGEAGQSGQCHGNSHAGPDWTASQYAVPVFPQQRASITPDSRSGCPVGRSNLTQPSRPRCNCLGVQLVLRRDDLRSGGLP